MFGARTPESNLKANVKRDIYFKIPTVTSTMCRWSCVCETWNRYNRNRTIWSRLAQVSWVSMKNTSFILFGLWLRSARRHFSCRNTEKNRKKVCIRKKQADMRSMRRRRRIKTCPRRAKLRPWPFLCSQPWFRSERYFMVCCAKDRLDCGLRSATKFRLVITNWGFGCGLWRCRCEGKWQTHARMKCIVYSCI